MDILLIILGACCEIVNANGWFFVPPIVKYILFGIGGISLVIKFLVTLFTGRKINNSFKKFR